MDLSDINRVANRKRINTDAEKLREKVSRETAKIIKLKVAQDTAYWDLKEKLHQVEGNHERLRQNMVEVQMQHEAVSGRYQEELRLRPDSLNRLSGARGVCDVLEAYSSRLRAAVSRCRSDQAALSAAYKECGTRVRRAASYAAGERRAAATETKRVHAVARQAQEQLIQASATVSRYEAELKRAADERNVLREELAKGARALEAERNEAQKTLLLYEQRVREAREQGEQQTRVIAEQQLRNVEKLSREHYNALQDAIRENNDLKLKLSTIAEVKRDLENAIQNKDRDIESLQTEVASNKEKIEQLKKENSVLKLEITKLTEDSQAKTVKIDEMATNIKDLETKIAEMEISLNTEKEENTRYRNELSASSVELDAKTAAISSLMVELRAEADARSRAEANLMNTRSQLEEQQQRGTTLTERIQRLDTEVREKDDEISRQIKIILEVRNEKERLQSKISGMQGTIDNIQKELTGRAPHAPSEPPRRDTDALYSFLSDTSVDDVLDPREVGRRFAALASGATGPQSAISLSQLKGDFKLKKTFFKNKRNDAKIKKIK